MPQLSCTRGAGARPPQQGTKKHRRVSSQPAAVLPPAGTPGTGGGDPTAPTAPHTGLRWVRGAGAGHQGRAGARGAGWSCCGARGHTLLPGHSLFPLRSSAPGGALWVTAQHGGVGWTRVSWRRGTEHSKGSFAEGGAWWWCCTLTCSQKAACTAHLPGHPPPRCPACAGSHPQTAKIQT